ncbi:hemagglutinin repeat-containing protein [Selenomonas artemidis]|uniref:hemagglutinin repeat-containing protein n=1 Tax=Selenomonas artemidis TaxID=671224 RepID=UPI0004088240|nr:hemagglutinin repeat-containing protein [Selenomonas artemidis]
MIRKKILAKRIAAYLTLGMFTFQQISFAAAVPDEAAPEERRPIVTSADNGIPVVNIAARNGAGVSINEYSELSIDPAGLILNNGYTISRTELAGWIDRNPNLAYGPAQIIVNQVTGAGITNMNGFLEVAGGRADVVIANENGIRVNGGGFINTDRAVLTTGRPEFGRDGSLDRIRVTEGAVSFEGKGIDARGANSLEVLTRAERINADIFANHTTHIGGANDISYGSLTAAPIEGTGETPTVTLDAAAVGGMYANKIRLVGTEKGLGVNMGGKLVASEAAAIDADGTLHVTGLINSGGSTAVTAEKIQLDEGGRIYGNDISIKADTLVNQRNEAPEQNLQKEVRLLKEKSEALDAVVRQDVTQLRGVRAQRRYQLDIKEATAAYEQQRERTEAARTALANHEASAVAARRNLSVEAGTIKNSADSILYNGSDMTLNAKDAVVNSGGRIESGGNMRITAPTVRNENSAFSVQRVVSPLRSNPVRIRIDEPGNREEGQTFDAGEFDKIDNGYGAYHRGNPDKFQLCTFIHTQTQTSENALRMTNAGVIESGGNLTVAGSLVNDNSQVVAGKHLSITGATDNIAAQTDRRTVTFGYTRASYTDRRNRIHKGHVRKYRRAVFMTPQAEDAQPRSLGIAALGDKEDVTLATRRNVNGFLDPFSIDKTAQEHLRLGDGITTLKDPGALFKLHPEPGAKYLIETDPAFTDKKRFLSSDYMLEQLKWDPDKIQKRLGDGFYERRLIIDQILQRTGTIPGGDEDADAAIKALMDAGIAAAKDLQLAPGIALSKEQIAKLKSDIIWIEEQEVEVGGIREKVLVPHVYFTSTNGLTLSPDGSIISARSIDIQTQEDVHNAGLILGKEDLRVDAKTFANEGDIYAGTAVVKTSGDIRQNGSITAERKAELTAGGSISSENNIEHFAHQDVVRRMADISVTGDDGTLTLDAQKDIDLKGATLSAGGKNAAVIVNAGENIRLTTDTLSADKDMTQSGDNYLRTKRSTELGTTIKAGSDVSLHAGENIEARAAYIRSDEGSVTLNADKDISLTAGREISDDAYGIKYKSQGLLSSTKTTVRSRRESDHAIGTTISGKNVDIAADNDIELRAANIAADENAAVRAKGTVSLTPEARRDITENYKSVKKSGIMGQGFGVFIGTKKTTDTYEGDALTRRGTTIAATGSISISADQDAHLTNAALYAGKDASITAAGVKLDGKDNIIKEKYTHEVSQSGLSISLGGAVMDTYNDIARPVRRIGAVRDDRLRGLYAWEIGRKLYDLTKKPADGIARYKELLKGKNAFGLNIGLGSSRSSSTTEILSYENTGSKIEAGTDLSLRAREKDISMTGGTLQGKNVTLEAKKNIDLRAAENTTHTVTKERSSSAGVSATYTFGAGITSVGINAERAASDGIGDRTTYTPAIIQAQEKLSMTSGADTNIIGSQASGKKVNMKVGGNLNIESLQEKDDYREKNSSSGFNISASMSGGINTNDPDIAASYSKGKIHSNWKSTTGQAGIYAGADGFHIHVKKNTDLKGAVIASEAASDKNTLSTENLTYGNIENSASYSASSKGLSYRKFASGAYGAGEGYNMKGLTPVLSVPAQGDAASTTKSAIAPGSIDVRKNPNQDLSDLSRNTSNALNELGRIFDKKKIEEQQELAAVFGEEAYRLAHNMKDDGSGRKILVHAAIGGIMSRITGVGFTSGAVGAGLNEAVIKEIDKIAKHDPGAAQIVSAIIGAAAAKAVGGTAGAGASAATSGTKNNWLGAEQNDFVHELSEALESRDQEKINEVLAKYYALSNYYDQHGMTGEGDDQRITASLYPLLECLIPEDKKYWLDGGLNYTLNNIVCMDPALFALANQKRHDLEVNGYAEGVIPSNDYHVAERAAEVKMNSEIPKTNYATEESSVTTKAVGIATDLVATNVLSRGLLLAPSAYLYARYGEGESLYFSEDSVVSYEIVHSQDFIDEIRTRGRAIPVGSSETRFTSVKMNASGGIDPWLTFGTIKLAITITHNMDNTYTVEGVAEDLYNFEHLTLDGWKKIVEMGNNIAYDLQKKGEIRPYTWKANIHATIHEKL